VNCVTKEPRGTELAAIEMPGLGAALTGDIAGSSKVILPLTKYKKFTSQKELGEFLVNHYKIRTPKELTSCEVCHR
jgi:hypothetical protein